MSATVVIVAVLLQLEWAAVDVTQRPRKVRGWVQGTKRQS